MSAQIVPFRHSAGIAVGGVNLPNRVLLAPMSGITDAPFRRLAGKTRVLGCIFSNWPRLIM